MSILINLVNGVQYQGTVGSDLVLNSWCGVNRNDGLTAKQRPYSAQFFT